MKLVHVDMTRTPVLVFVILTYGLHTGAYMSEMIRASVMAVDKGQVEAAYATGMTGFQAFTRIRRRRRSESQFRYSPIW